MSHTYLHCAWQRQILQLKEFGNKLEEFREFSVLENFALASKVVSCVYIITRDQSFVQWLQMNLCNTR
jgi:hypothetical protein